MTVQNSKILYFTFLFCILIFTFCILANKANAAVLYFEPVDGQYYLEDIFVVKVKLDTGEEEINAVQANLKFSQDLLEIKDFSKGDSLLFLWLGEAVFSNKSGEISFTGGIPKGYQGDGLLGKIIFKVRETPHQNKFDAGQADAKIQILDTSQVLLNDGLGTPAGLTTKKAIFTILPEKLDVPRDEWQEMLKEDDIPPEPFEIIVSQDRFLFNGQYFIIFSATDKQTGVDYYEVKEGTREWKRAESPYLLEDQELKSIIKVRAVDKAGNKRVVEYIPPREPFAWWIVILILIGTGAICWIIRLRNRRKKDAKHYE